MGVDISGNVMLQMPVLILKALRVFDEALKGGVGLPCPAVENYQPNAKVLIVEPHSAGPIRISGT